MSIYIKKNIWKKMSSPILEYRERLIPAARNLPPLQKKMAYIPLFGIGASPSLFSLLIYVSRFYRCNYISGGVFRNVQNSIFLFILLLISTFLLLGGRPPKFSKLSINAPISLLFLRGVKDIIKECAKNPHFHKTCKEFGSNLAKSTVRYVRNNKKAEEIIEKNNLGREEGEKSTSTPNFSNKDGGEKSSQHTSKETNCPPASTPISELHKGTVFRHPTPSQKWEAKYKENKKTPTWEEIQKRKGEKDLLKKIREEKIKKLSGEELVQYNKEKIINSNKFSSEEKNLLLKYMNENEGLACNIVHKFIISLNKGMSFSPQVYKEYVIELEKQLDSLKKEGLLTEKEISSLEDILTPTFFKNLLKFAMKGALIGEEEYARGKEVISNFEREIKKLPEREKISSPEGISAVAGKIDESLAIYGIEGDLEREMPGIPKENDWKVHPLGGGPILEKDLPPVNSGKPSDSDAYISGPLSEKKEEGSILASTSISAAIGASRKFLGWLDFKNARKNKFEPDREPLKSSPGMVEVAENVHQKYQPPSPPLLKGEEDNIPNTAPASTIPHLEGEKTLVIVAFQTTGNNDLQNQELDNQLYEANRIMEENVTKGRPYKNIEKGTPIKTIIRTDSKEILQKLEEKGENASISREEGEVFNSSPKCGGKEEIERNNDEVD